MLVYHHYEKLDGTLQTPFTKCSALFFAEGDEIMKINSLQRVSFAALTAAHSALAAPLPVYHAEAWSPNLNPRKWFPKSYADDDTSGKCSNIACLKDMLFKEGFAYPLLFYNATQKTPIRIVCIFCSLECMLLCVTCEGGDGGKRVERDETQVVH